jgi:hypothetical protein
MTYDEVKKHVFASGLTCDGYRGSQRQVDFALVEGKILCVADCGFFDSGLPTVVDKNEALWILSRHPQATCYKVLTRFEESPIAPTATANEN